MTFTDIKNQSFSVFKENFNKCVAVSFTVFLIKTALVMIIMTFQLVSMKLFGMQCITGLASLVFYLLYVLAYVFIFMPLSFGKSLFILKIARGENPDTDSVFDCIKTDYLYSVCIKSRQALANLLTVFLIFVGCASVYTFGVNIVYILAVGIMVWLCFLVTLALRYSSLANAAVLCGMKDVNKTMRKAVRTSRKNKRRVLGLVFMHTGWLLLSLITFGIGFIFIGSYISISIKKYYLSIERGF